MIQMENKNKQKFVYLSLLWFNTFGAVAEITERRRIMVMMMMMMVVRINETIVGGCDRY